MEAKTCQDNGQFHSSNRETTLINGDHCPNGEYDRSEEMADKIKIYETNFHANRQQYRFEDVDEIFDEFSSYGWYQTFLFITIQYLMINAAGNYIFISFASLAPICDSSDIVQVKDACEMKVRCPENATHWYFKSLYTDDIVCPSAHLPQNLQTIQSVGSLIGALLGGHISDHYGRRWVSTFGALLMVAFGMLGSVAINWRILALTVLGVGCSSGFFFDASMTLSCETVGRKHRIIQNLAFQWSLSLQIAAAIAYFTGSWRRYLFAINSTALPALFLMLFWVESPRWLIQQLRYEDAARCINTILKWNRISVKIKGESLNDIQVDSSQRGTLHMIFLLCADRNIRKYTLVLILAALTVEMSAAVILFDIQVLAGNPFLNIALYGLLRIWVPALIIYLENYSARIGRRILYVTSQGITVFCFLFALVISLLGEPHWIIGLLKTVLLLIGGVINSSIFFIAYKQYVMELYPTVIRAFAVGAFGAIERAGGAIAPQLININHHTLSNMSFAITSVLLISSLIAGWKLLPETRLHSLPDIVEMNATSQEH